MPRWMQRDNDWDGAYQNRHLDLEAATEVNAERRRAQQASRELNPRRGGLHAEVAIPGAVRGVRVVDDPPR